MAYQSLYRRYRPQRFSEVKGQDHVSRTLANAVRDGRVTHAYLFSGPRGTGKTSTARILAKALNCAAPSEGEPCGVCESCVAIAEGRSLDVVEMDAASNRGIDAMRDLVSRVSLASPGQWKVYIVDEVHMLTTEASNTLLKTLEEPPDNVVFVLATTEPQKVLPTIQSRTQRFEFRLLPPRLLVEHLSWVAADAGLEVAPEAIELVARRGSGSARDALSALDQAAAAGGIDAEGVHTEAIVEALCDRDAAAALVAAAERCAAGHDPRTIARELVEHLRQALIVTIDADLVGLPDDERTRLEGQARRLGRAAAVRGMEVLGQALIDMREAPDPRVLLDVSLARLSRPDLDDSPAALLERIERLEKALAAGGRARPTPGVEAGAAPPGDRPEGAQPAADGPATDRRPAADGPPADREPAPRPSTGAAARPAGPAGARKALGGVRRSAAPPPERGAPPPGRAAPPRPSSAAPPRPAPERAPAPAPDSSAQPFPTREELTLAWGDHVLAALPQRPRSRFRSGRFLVPEGGVARFALPDGFHLQRCREVQAEVEAGLAAHFGRPVPLELLVDDGATPADRGPAAGEEAPADDEPVDWDELTDAPPGAIASPIEHVLQAFEGAEIVEERED